MKKHGDDSIDSGHWPDTSRLLEEMGKLQQVLGKLLGTGGEVNHWDGSNLRERLVEELADLKAAIWLFENFNLTSEEKQAIVRRFHKKLDLFEKWHKEKTKP